jgi:hypothetical protein
VGPACPRSWRCGGRASAAFVAGETFLPLLLSRERGLSVLALSGALFAALVGAGRVAYAAVFAVAALPAAVAVLVARRAAR